MLIKLNGRKLTVWQRCKRLYAIEEKKRFVLWHATTLFSAVMRRAIVQLSNGVERSKVETEAVSMFVAQARAPGLDVPDGMDTYRLSMDFCATIRTILAYLARITLTPLSEPDKLVTRLDDQNSVEWTALAHKDETGMLHRWVFMSSVNADDVVVEAHKWETVGDIVVYDVPMMLHMVSIGRTEGGRRYSPWCRAYKNPVIAGQIRFKKRSMSSGSANFPDTWPPIYLGDNQKNDADSWVDGMIEDSVHEGLMVHRVVGQPGKKHVEGFYRDVKRIAEEIMREDAEGRLAEPMNLPMSRPACDVPYACQHQLLCYGDRSMEQLGLYEDRRVDPFSRLVGAQYL